MVGSLLGGVESGLGRGVGSGGGLIICGALRGGKGGEVEWVEVIGGWGLIGWGVYTANNVLDLSTALQPTFAIVLLHYH